MYQNCNLFGNWFITHAIFLELTKCYTGHLQSIAILGHYLSEGKTYMKIQLRFLLQMNITKCDYCEMAHARSITVCNFIMTSLLCLFVNHVCLP